MDGLNIDPIAREHMESFYREMAETATAAERGRNFWTKMMAASIISFFAGALVASAIWVHAINEGMLQLGDPDDGVTPTLNTGR